MTDIESLRIRDNQFSIEEKLLCCVWVHDRQVHRKSYGKKLYKANLKICLLN